MASKDPKIRAIEIAAKKANPNDRKARFNERNRLRAEQGLGAEKHKRGGIPGVYDRNKNIIKPALTIGAGLLTGGAALPALLGGAIGGLDREGKSGVGFDFGDALKGGLRGAAEGFGGSMLGAAGAGAVGARSAGGNILTGALDGLKMGLEGSAGGRLLGDVGGALKSNVLGAVSSGSAIDPQKILGVLAKGIPLIQGMNAQGEANRRSAASAGMADDANAQILELAKLMMMRGMGGSDLSFLRDEQNPYTNQFRPALPAPARM